MEKFSTEYFKKLASDLMFYLSEEQIEALKEDFQAVEAQVELFDTIDTEGVEPMVYPFENPTVYLRKDIAEKPLTQAEALANSDDVKMGHIHVPKVVK